MFAKMKVILTILFSIYLLINDAFCMLRSCSEETEANRVCENGNSKSWPIELDTQLYLRDIGKINEEENLITMQISLYNWWTDSSLDPSNTSKSLVVKFSSVSFCKIKYESCS